MNKLSIKDASKLMGVSPMLLRLMIQERKIPEDICFCVKQKHRHYYYINKNKFLKYIKG